MSEKTTLSTLHQKAYPNKQKTTTIEIDPNKQYFFKVPYGYYLTFVWLGGTTYAPKLSKLL